MCSTPRKDLTWTPRDAGKDEGIASCRDEHLRGMVFPTRPKILAWTPPPTVAVVEIRELLHEQSSALIGRMEVMMSRQEAALKQLLVDGHVQSHVSSNACRWNYGNGHVSSNGHVPSNGNSKQGKAADATSKLPLANDDAIVASIALGQMQVSQLQVAREEDGVGTYTSTISRLSFLRKIRPPGALQTSNQMFWEAIRLLKAPGGLLSGKQNLQEFCLSILKNQFFDILMLMTIIFNTVLIVIETDKDARCNADEGPACAPSWIATSNLVLLVIYTVESMFVIYAYRCKIFREPSRVFETSIVILGYIDYLLLEVFGDSLPSLQSLRLIRLTRLLRGMRLFHFFPELRSMMTGFVHAMRVMIWGFLMLMLLLLVVAIASVQVIHPWSTSIQHDSEYCSQAFASVWHATCWFFQTAVAGDSWGACSLPLIQARPLAFVYFGVILVAVQVGFLNLVMSVIVEHVVDARSKDKHTQVVEKEKAIEASRRKWFNLFEKLDKDGNGQLSIEEVLAGFDSIPDFSDDLKLLGIQREDLPKLMKLMDEDNDNQVCVIELVSMFDMVVHFDNKMHQVAIGMQLRVIGQRLEMRLRSLQKHIDRFARYRHTGSGVSIESAF